LVTNPIVRKIGQYDSLKIIYK